MIGGVSLLPTTPPTRKSFDPVLFSTSVRTQVCGRKRDFQSLPSCFASPFFFLDQIFFRCGRLNILVKSGISPPFS